MPIQDSRTNYVQLLRHYKYTVTGCGENTDEPSTQVLGVFHSNRKQRAWGLTPNYTALVRSKANLPDQPFEATFKVSDLRSRLISTYRSVVSTMNGGQPCNIATFMQRDIPFGYITAPDDGGSISTFTDLKFKVLKKAKESQFNVPIFIAEAGKTATMVAARAGHLVQLIRSLRRGDIGWFFSNLRLSEPIPRSAVRRATRRFNSQFARDSSQAAAGVWLEFTYGWKPFMKDVYDAVVTLQDVCDSPSRRVGRSSANSTAVNISRQTVTIESNPGHSALRTRTINDQRRVQWRFGVNQTDIPARFGLLNPLEVAWELVPFSFVADWFLPIGNYLSALDVPFRYNHIGGTTGVRRVTQDVWSNPTSTYYSTATGSAVHMCTYVQRTPLTSAPIPSITEFTAEFNVGAARAISSISLLSQQLSRLRR